MLPKHIFHALLIPFIASALFANLYFAIGTSKSNYISPLGIGFAIAQESDMYPKHVFISSWYAEVDPLVGKDSPGDLGVSVGKFVTQVSRARKTYHDGTFTDIELLCESIIRNHESAESGFGLLLFGGGDSGNVGDVSVTLMDTQKSLNEYCLSDLANDEWIEITNPTDQTVNLKEWTLTDNSDIKVVFETNAFILPKRTVRIIRNGSGNLATGLTNTLFLKHQIGDGLDNNGDRVALFDQSGRLTDAVSFGNDKTYQTESVIRSDGAWRRQF